MELNGTEFTFDLMCVVRPLRTRSELRILCTNYWLTDFIEQNPSSEANSHSSSQEIPYIIWNPNVRYRVYKSSPLVPILSHINPIHILPPNFPGRILILSFSLRLGLLNSLFHSGLPTKILYVFLMSLMGATCHAKLIINVIFWPWCINWDTDFFPRLALRTVVTSQ